MAKLSTGKWSQAKKNNDDIALAYMYCYLLFGVLLQIN